MPALTGLRGVAALWVLAFHVYETGPVVGEGWLGVDVFFILSGFILSHVYQDDFGRVSLEGYFRFLQVRLARIYPLHLFALAVLLLAVCIVPGFFDHYGGVSRFGLSSLIASALLVQNWAFFLPTSWNVPSWSLSAEWAAYLIFPFLVAPTLRIRRPEIAIAIAVGALALGGGLLFFKGASANSAGAPGMVRMAGEFLCGCLMYRAFNLGWRMRAGSDFLILAGLALVFLLPQFAYLSTFVFAFVVLKAAGSEGIIAKSLSFRPVVWLGEISFSLYLLHWTALQTAKMLGWPFLGPAGLREIAFLGLMLAVAAASHRYIEVPARQWGRKLSRQRQPPPTAPVAATLDG